MPLAHRVHRFVPTGFVSAVLIWLAVGCSTTEAKWGSRVGHATYDDTVREMGPPDRVATLSDGSIVGEWLMSRGYDYVTGYPAMYSYRRMGYYSTWPSTGAVSRSPDLLVRLTFGPDKVLQGWKKVYR